MTEQIDMSRFVEAKSDQLNADDLIGTTPENGRTITVTRVTGSDGDQPIAIHYERDGGKPFKPCKTMRRVLLAIWGKYANEYVGKSMTVYRDDSVTFGGLAVGGIRISHMSHIDKETLVVVMKTKGKKAGIKIKPLTAKVMQHPATEAPAKTGADGWAEKFITAVKTCADAAAITDLTMKQAARLAEMAEKRPDLKAEIDRVIAECTAFLAGGSVDDDLDWVAGQ